MPKKSKDFPDQLSYNVTKDLRRKLIALGYLWGAGGEYAMPARNLLTEAVGRYIDGMDDRKRRDFDEILSNIVTREEAESLNNSRA